MLDKYETERYALDRIKLYYCKDLSDFEDMILKLEPPDFYIRAKSLAIEVTEAINKEDAEIRSWDNRMAQEDLSSDKRNEIIKSKNLKDTVKEQLYYRSCLGGGTYRRGIFRDASDNIRIVCMSIVDKTEKLNKKINYGIQDEVNNKWLYIISFWNSFNQFDIEKIVTHWKSIQNKYHDHFDIIFIDCNTDIYVLYKDRGFTILKTDNKYIDLIK
ncbi:MAG: hypothetical protein Q4D77_02605 [Peptostreptococcaceae bacterium]|nr:hypothetical protein [Peptostreptococcaceae bacterium]